MKRLLSLAVVIVLSGSMFAVSVDTADAGNGRRGALIAGLIIGGVTAGMLAGHAHAHRAPRYYAPRGHRYRHGYGPVWQQHVSYCYGRYRSYNHHTNLFLAYSGNYRHCRSPWIR